MEWVEITARTVTEATERALDELGVAEGDAEVQVLEEPRPGLFGRTKGTARVRARVVPRQHRPKQERRDRRRSGTREGRGRNGGGRGTGGTPTPAGDGDTSGDEEQGDRASRDGASRQGGARNGRPRRRRRGGSGRSGGSGSPTDAAAEADPAPDAPSGAPDSAGEAGRGDTVDTQTLSFDEHVDHVEQFVTGLVDAFGADGQVEVVEVDDETREVRVAGDDLGLLIGPRGLTLQAVHELARTVVYRAAPDGQDGRVRIDIGGYRERRREALVRFATKVAEDVSSSGRAKALEPMSPPDRKVVHDTINEIEGVSTTSEGQEPRRRVVVVPEG